MTLARGINAFFFSSLLSRRVGTSVESSRWIVSRAVAHALLPCAMKLFRSGYGAHDVAMRVSRHTMRGEDDNAGRRVINAHLAEARRVKALEEALRLNHRQVENMLADGDADAAVVGGRGGEHAVRQVLDGEVAVGRHRHEAREHHRE